MNSRSETSRSGHGWTPFFPATSAASASLPNTSRCGAAADLEHRGQYEAAREALGELWRGVGLRPSLERLGELAAAEALLRAGTLSGWLGSARQIEGAQDAAKDLIGESISRFQAMGEVVRAAAARGELGYCYYRAGAYDEARVIYHEALEGLRDGGQEVRARILLRLAIVESISGRYNDALRTLTDSARLFEESDDDALKGKFHNDLACVLTCLAKAERRPDYADRAIIEYAAASHYFELAGHVGYRASAENNLGFLLHLAGRNGDAHEHLAGARSLFQTVGDEGRIAQVDDARARVLLAEGRAQEARRVIGDAVRTLERGGEQAFLAEALTTQGLVLARLGEFVESLDVLKRAADLAEQAGALEDAGRALLTLIEEHAARLTERDLLEIYQRADGLLKGTQDAETVSRLRACAARIASARLDALRPPPPRGRAYFWAGFSLTEKVHAYEARYIRRALVEAHGSVTNAARLLGIDHHAKLAWMLAGRHKELAHLRTPPEPRKRSIITIRQRRRQPPAVSSVIILCVESSEGEPDTVKDTLEGAGWTVELCADAAEVVRKIESKAHYDLIILDNQPPGRDGLELTRRARELAHRRRTPIIMISASDVERDAWRAGANAFLRKPQDLGQLEATVRRLLPKGDAGGK